MTKTATTPAPSTPQPYLYRQVIQLVRQSIESGTLRPGDRLPSLRRMSQSAGVSVPTVRQAYIELERQRRVESRPRSGFYVRHRSESPLVLPAPRGAGEPAALRSRPLLERVLDAVDRPDLVALGIANPCLAKPAAKALHRTMRRVMSRLEERSLSYSATLGEPSLRRQIAYRYLDVLGVQVDPENLCITNGGQEALLLALKAVTSPGDIVAVESPTYHGLLELIDSLGLLALEVETCPEEGVSLTALRATLERYQVAACVFSTTLANPLGVSMTQTDRRDLAELVAEFGVVLIEDDVYGDLLFDGSRPVPAQFLGTEARVLTCGSFSKTAAPGYRIGWVVPGAEHQQVARLKRSLSCSSGFLQQLTLADFLASGDYGRHLHLLRAVLRRNAERMSALIAEHFPPGTRTSRPVGGSVLWVELPQGASAADLFDEATQAGISIAPGPIFSPCGRYPNFVRLSFGQPWTEEVEGAVAWLGRRVVEIAAGAAKSARA